MNIGVTQWTLDVKGAATVARASELGFKFVQLDAGGWSGWVEKLDAANRDDYAQASRETGVELVGIGVNPVNEYSLLSSAGSAELREAVGVVMGAIEQADYLNIPLVYVPAFNASEMKRDGDIQKTAEVLAELAGYAAERGIELASENTLDAAGQLRLLDYANTPNLKLFIDTQNPALWGHRVADLLEPLKPHLCKQIHAKDGRGGVMGNAPLGGGEAEFEQTAREIKRLDLAPLLISENEYGQAAERLAAKDIGTLERLFAKS